MKPKVSIIVPVYNVEKYLNRCVESLLHQTLKEIEIILVDDESPDNSPKLCDDYASKDSRIKVIHKKNEGLGCARNSGLEIASGEYVAFIDSDDFIDTNAYFITYNKAIENDLDICYFRHCRFSSVSSVFQSKTYNKEIYFLSRKDIDNFLLEMVGSSDKSYGSEKFSMSACMAIYRTSKLKEYNIRFKSERKIASEDLVFHIQLLPHINRIGYLPNVFYYYFFNPNSITTNYSIEKYNRLMRLLDYVRNELSIHYDWNVFKNSYIRQILRVYRVILRFESLDNISINAKLKRIKLICNQPILNDLYSFNFKRLNNKDKILVYCMKHKLSLLIYILYKLKRYAK